eukprot:3744802-Rhodomonas_salina.2
MVESDPGPARRQTRRLRACAASAESAGVIQVFRVSVPVSGWGPVTARRPVGAGRGRGPAGGKWPCHGDSGCRSSDVREHDHDDFLASLHGGGGTASLRLPGYPVPG